MHPQQEEKNARSLKHPFSLLPFDNYSHVGLFMEQFVGKLFVFDPEMDHLKFCSECIEEKTKYEVRKSDLLLLLEHRAATEEDWKNQLYESGMLTKDSSRWYIKFLHNEKTFSLVYSPLNPTLLFDNLKVMVEPGDESPIEFFKRPAGRRGRWF